MDGVFLWFILRVGVACTHLMEVDETSSREFTRNEIAMINPSTWLRSNQRNVDQ